MLKEVAEGVRVHESAFLQSHAVVVEGRAGVLLIDPGIDEAEMAGLARELDRSGRAVAAGFSTHPHWDHLLWHPELGAIPRYATARCAADARAFLTDPHWKDSVSEMLPPEVAGNVPLDLLGLVTGLAEGATLVPWDGPRVRILEHRAHAAGHAALLLEERRVLVAGDMLSDILVPLLDLEAADPIEDYLAGLRLLESVASDVDVVVPGHGSVAGRDEARTRIERDRRYVEALRDRAAFDDPRIGPAARPGWEWVNDVHAGQVQGLSSLLGRG